MKNNNAALLAIFAISFLLLQKGANGSDRCSKEDAEIKLEVFDENYNNNKNVIDAELAFIRGGFVAKNSPAAGPKNQVPTSTTPEVATTTTLKSCAQPVIANVTIFCPKGINPGAACIVNCDDGFTTCDVTTNIVCSAENLTWSSGPNCIPAFSIINGSFDIEDATRACTAMTSSISFWALAIIANQEDDDAIKALITSQPGWTLPTSPCVTGRYWVAAFTTAVPPTSTSPYIWTDFSQVTPSFWAIDPRPQPDGEDCNGNAIVGGLGYASGCVAVDWDGTLDDRPCDSSQTAGVICKRMCPDQGEQGK